MTVDVIVPLAQGFEETEATTIIDILRRAEAKVLVAGLEPGPVRGALGITILPDVQAADLVGTPFDAVVLPGGLAGTERLAGSDVVAQLLDQARRQDRLIGAICAAPTVLERAGLLEGRQATCHFTKEAELTSARFATDDVVVDGRIVTSRGVGTALPFALKLVALLVSPEKAEEIGQAIHFRG